MAYDLLVGGEEYDLATIAGWHGFKQEVKEPGPALTSLIENGQAGAEGLLKDVAALSGLSKPAESIRKGMESALKGAKGMAVLSDGLTSEDVEDDWYV